MLSDGGAESLAAAGSAHDTLRSALVEPAAAPAEEERRPVGADAEARALDVAPRDTGQGGQRSWVGVSTG